MIRAKVAVIKDNHTWEDLTVDFETAEVRVDRLWEIARREAISRLYETKTVFLDVCTLEALEIRS